MAYQMAATAVTLNDLEGHSPVADLFKCNPSNIYATFYRISTDNVLTRFLCISRASWYSLGSGKVSDSNDFGSFFVRDQYVLLKKRVDSSDYIVRGDLLIQMGLALWPLVLPLPARHTCM